MSDFDQYYEIADAESSKTVKQDPGSIRKNSYIVIRDRHCKVVEVSKCKPGKHGHAKYTFVAIDILLNQRRDRATPERRESPLDTQGRFHPKMEDVVPAAHKCDVPHVSRDEYQLLDINEDDYVSLLKSKGDTKDDLRLPNDDVLVNQMRHGFESGKDLTVTVLCAMGEEQICAVKESAS